MSRPRYSASSLTWLGMFTALFAFGCGGTSSPASGEDTTEEEDEKPRGSKPSERTDAGEDETPTDDGEEPPDDELSSSDKPNPPDDEPSAPPAATPATPPPAAPDGTCSQGDEGCSCYPNETCNGSLSCLSSICVSLGEAPPPAPPTPNTPATPDTPATPQTPTPPPPATPNPPPAPPNPPPASPSSDIIDNFATCDSYINEVDGRSGSWYSWADNGINLDFAVRTPPSGWSNQGCAALATGGELPSGETDYAGIGLILANGEPYDLRGYSGLTVSIETGDDVSVAIKTLSGGQFGYRLGPTVGSETTNIDFNYFGAWANSTSEYLDLSEVIEIQFVPHSVPFGFAVHLVSLF